jgi:hypothetical protein
MSTVETNLVQPSTGTTLTLGASGDTVTIPSGATIANSGTATGFVSDGDVTVAKLSTSATEADNVNQRVAKAWVNFNGTSTVAINDDLNVTSITDLGVGLYTVNMTTALSSSSYAVSGCAGYDATTAQTHMRVVTLTGSFDTSSFSISTTYANNSAQDLERVHVTVFGD